MKRLAAHLPLLLTVFASLGLLLYGPIAQFPDYNEFADRRNLLGMPNAADVLSNAGFALVGVWGLLRLWSERQHPKLAAGWPGYCLFLIALVLTAVGSASYHLAPDNARLVWDRLPIAFACAGLLAAVRAETCKDIDGAGLAVLLSIAGALSVGWWYLTERTGYGDLRPYLLLQGLPLCLIPLWHVIHGVSRGERMAFVLAAVLYGAAKVAELNDQALFSVLDFISGHTIKHLMATAAAAVLVGHLLKRVQEHTHIGVRTPVDARFRPM